MHQETKAAYESTVVGAKAGYEKAKEDVKQIVIDVMEVLAKEQQLIFQQEDQPHARITIGVLSCEQRLLDSLLTSINMLDLKEQS